jgi:integrase
MSKITKARIENEPWNKGKAVGQMTPFTPDQADLVRATLANEFERLANKVAQMSGKEASAGELLRRQALAALRDLALFNTGIDTMLRASDLLRLRVIDVCDHTGAIVEEIPIRQKKTKEPHVVQLLQPSREAIKAWIEIGNKTHDHFLFTSLSNRNFGEPITRGQYGNLVKKWADYARLDPRRHSTHSMRRTKSAAVYAATNNLAACRELLGHKNIGSTAHYLGVDKRQALDIAKKIKV